MSTSPLPKTLRLFSVLSTFVSAAFNVFCTRAHLAAACGGFICVALSVFGKTEDLLSWIGELDGVGEGVCVCVPYHGWHSALDFSETRGRFIA